MLNDINKKCVKSSPNNWLINIPIKNMDKYLLEVKIRRESPSYFKPLAPIFPYLWNECEIDCSIK
jgi:hypothetical protein